jgi:hypothetical protein
MCSGRKTFGNRTTLGSGNNGRVGGNISMFDVVMVDVAMSCRDGRWAI